MIISLQDSKAIDKRELARRIMDVNRKDEKEEGDQY